MVNIDLSPPADDEAEVTLIGPGYGESVVVHLGNGEWLVNDSSVSRPDSAPAALQYLERIGVDPSKQVALVVASHWHDDHVRGISQVYMACTSATFVCASALRSHEFLALAEREEYDGSRLGSGVREIYQVITEVEKRHQKPAHTSTRPAVRFAAQDMQLYAAQVSQHTARVHSLSPSSIAQLRSVNDISKLLIDDPNRRLRVPSLEPNSASVVLWIDVPAARILLGADLEKTSNVQDGWDGILRSTTKPTGQASAYKVAHHGSITGHHEDLQSAMLDDDAVFILTPWRRGRSSLPTSSDRLRICSTAESAYTTVQNPSSSKRRRDPAVTRTLREMRADVRTIDAQHGQIQLRRRPGEASWRVALAPISGSLCG